MPGPEAPQVFHPSTALADVRGRAHRHHAVRCVDDLRICLLVEPRCRPRLWGRVAQAVIEGFEPAFRAGTAVPGERRVMAALAGARDALRRVARQLVERSAPDANVLALWLEEAFLWGGVVGGGRAYRHVQGHTERMSPRNLPPEGLMDAAPQAFSAEVEPGSTIFAGTEPTFCAEAVQRSAEMLLRDPALPPARLVKLLTHPAEKAGVGAAAVAFRASPTLGEGRE